MSPMLFNDFNLSVCNLLKFAYQTLLLKYHDFFNPHLILNSNYRININMNK